jgi:probable HAF family extracellular repeat protein
MATILAAIVFAVPTAALAELPKYQMLNLGTFGGSTSAATAINNKGQVTGHAATKTAIPELLHAFLYTDGTMLDIGTLGPGFSSFGRDINDAGQVAGDSAELIADGVRHAFLFSDGNLIDLGTLAVHDLSFGIAINSVRTNRRDVRDPRR